MPSLQTHDGRTLSWREVGEGAPLLLHPGGPGCSSRYFGDLPELASGRTLILLDPRGTGDSDRPADPADYDLEAYAADIEAVREQLGLDKLDLLGHSHGGFVAMTWAGTSPDSVGRLILDSTAPRFTDEIRSRRMARVASHQGEPYFEDAVAALQDQQAGKYTSDAELAALYERAGPVMAQRGKDIAALADAYRLAGVNADAVRHFNHEVSNGMDLRPLLGRVQAPTLVIAGDDDPMAAPAADEIAEALPNATLARLPADHFMFLEPENVGAWSRTILDFLAD